MYKLVNFKAGESAWMWAIGLNKPTYSDIKVGARIVVKDGPLSSPLVAVEDKGEFVVATTTSGTVLVLRHREDNRPRLSEMIRLRKAAKEHRKQKESS